MVGRVITAIIVGIVAWILTALVGTVLVEVGLNGIGSFVKGIAGLVGLLVGAWHFITRGEQTYRL